MMVKEGGWGAMSALLLGGLGVVFGIAALGVLPVSRRAAYAIGVVTLALALLAPTVGLLGMASGRRKTDAALGGVEGRGTQARIRHEGFKESQSAARIGFFGAVLPLLLGGVAALLAARRRPDDPPDTFRLGLAGAAAGVALLTTGGALAASMGPLPPDVPRATASLLDARDHVDRTLVVGCDDLEGVLGEHYWHATDKDQWPRQFAPDPRAVVGDFDAVATRCARARFDDIKSGTRSYHSGKVETAVDILHSPLLVDDPLRTELQAAVIAAAKADADAAAWTSNHSIGDSFAANPKNLVSAGTVTVAGRLPPEVVRRIVRQSFGRFRLCYEAGLKHDPKLAGNVSVKFVIGHDGAVSSAIDAGSDLPDKKVVECVVKAFSNLSFPQPEGGIVTVTHPLVFSTQEP